MSSSQNDTQKTGSGKSLTIGQKPGFDLGRRINMGVYYTRLMIFFYEVNMFSSLQRLLLDRKKKCLL